MIGVNNPGLAAEVAAAIDKTFKNSLAETLTESEKAFVISFISMTEAILIAIKLISIVIIIIIMAVVANTMAMTVRERISEYAVLKTLGFGGFYVAGIIFGESIVISMIGCAAGIALTFPAVKIISETLSTFFPVFFVSRETIILDITASMAVGIMAAIFPTWRAINLRIADALRKVG